MHCLRCLMCVLTTLLISGNVAAQQITGSIRGTVSDPTGAVVQAAAVTTRQTETGLARTAMTDRGGNYLLVELPVGHYTIEVTAEAFASIFGKESR